MKRNKKKVRNFKDLFRYWSQQNFSRPKREEAL